MVVCVGSSGVCSSGVGSSGVGSVYVTVLYLVGVGSSCGDSSRVVVVVEIVVM